MSAEVYVYTMHEGTTRGKWSHYVFPWVIEHFAHLKDKLYCREGDNVHLVKEGELFDNAVVFQSIIQWPWLDFKKPGVTKNMVGFDNVGEGAASIEVGYNQTDLTAFTPAFTIPADTLPEQIIPIAVSAPTLSIRLKYQSDEDWEWNSFILYLNDHAVGK